MKNLKLWVGSALVACSLTAHADGIEKAKIPPPATAEKTAGSYIISKNFQLTKSVQGIDGVLQLLQDSRLARSLRDAQPGSAFSALYLADGKPRPLFKDNPPLGTVLRVLSQDQGFFQIVESHTYDLAPVAWLEEVRLSGSGRASYLLTQDLSTGMGSYNGPTTYFYEMVNGKLKPLEYFNGQTQQKAPLVLMRSLKTNWKLVVSRDGKSQDILQAACRPDFGNGRKGGNNFLVYYDRFHFDGKNWVGYKKVEKGFWEAESDDLPPLSKFPAGP
jgi:hypothetical protein